MSNKNKFHLTEREIFNLCVHMTTSAGDSAETQMNWLEMVDELQISHILDQLFGKTQIPELSGRYTDTALRFVEISDNLTDKLITFCTPGEKRPMAGGTMYVLGRVVRRLKDVKLGAYKPPA